DPCSGYLKVVTQRRNIRCDETKILGNERKDAQLSLHRVEEVSARTWDPMPGSSRRHAARYMPGGREPTKMIQANHIYVREQRAYTIDAPAIASALHRVPVIDRVSPQLSLRAEVIGGHASHKLWSMLFIQQEQLGICPNIGRVRRNEKGQVADQA